MACWMRPDYKAKNPLAVVPALDVEGRPVIESTVINEFIAVHGPGAAT